MLFATAVVASAAGSYRYAAYGESAIARAIAKALPFAATNTATNTRASPELEALEAENAKLARAVQSWKEKAEATEHRLDVHRSTRESAREELNRIREELSRAKEETKRELGRVKDESDEETKRVKREAEERKMEEVGALRERIRDMGRREVVERYGPGPHRVEFDLLLPVDADGHDTETTEKFILTVETAPLSLMPYAVSYFLRQISSCLWDGTTIFRSREHILVSRPFDHETGEDRYLKHRDAGTDHLAFREHSDEFPHVEYTLGYAGRPGGPHWYINTMDNADSHGPSSLEDEGDPEGDPCFAKIVGGDGKELVDRIMGLPKDEEDRFIRPVVIQGTRILMGDGEGGWTKAEA